MATFTITVQDLWNANFDFGLTPEDYPILREELRGFIDDEKHWQFNHVTDDASGQHFFGLNRLILDNYWHQEIGFETEDMFRFYLNKKMRQIMPYYNQLLHSETYQFDPFQTQDSTHTSATTNAENASSHDAQSTSGETTTDAKGRLVSSNFPQMLLSNDKDYASAGSDNNTQSTGSTTTQGTGDSTRQLNMTGNITSHVTGSQGHTAALLMQYRRSFLNVGMMIVNELQPLFMMVLDNNDSYMNERNEQNGPFGLGYPYFFPTL